MKWRFDNEPADVTVGDMFRHLADLADAGLISNSFDQLKDEDLHIASQEFSGTLLTVYEPDWVRQLIAHYQAAKTIEEKSVP